MDLKRINVCQNCWEAKTGQKGSTIYTLGPYVLSCKLEWSEFYLLLGSDPKGVTDLCFHTLGNFLLFFYLLPLLRFHSYPLSLGSPPHPFWAAARKGSMPFAFTHLGNFFLLLLLHPPLKSQSQGPSSSLEGPIPVLRPQSQSWGLNSSLKAQILAWRPRYQPWGPNLSHVGGIWASWLGFGPWGWDLDLKAGIWTFRLWFGPWD